MQMQAAMGNGEFPKGSKASDRGRFRERLLAASLVACGKFGYNEVAVRHILTEAGVSRQAFYTRFENMEDCFEQAYEAEAERLAERLLEVGRSQPSWGEGLRAALAELLEFSARHPAKAKALLVEVHAAGRWPMAKRDEVFERLASALDRARRVITASQAPPPITAGFILGGIETQVGNELIAGRSEGLRNLLPGLTHFAVLPYLGAKAAFEEMTAAPLSTWSARQAAGGQPPPD